MVYLRSGLTERPHGSVQKTLLGWMSRIGVWLRFVGFGGADGGSEVLTGCQLQLSDGSAFGWTSSELYCSLQLLS